MSHSVWSPEEDAYLISNYGRLSYPEMIPVIKRTRQSISKRARVLQNLGIIDQAKRKHCRPWTPEEDAELRGRVGWESLERICKALKRSRGSIKARLSYLEIDGSPKGVFTASQIAEIFGVHHDVITRWIRQNQLVAKKQGGKFYTQYDDLKLFIETRPHLYKRERITDSWWRWIVDRQPPSGLMSTSEVGIYLGYCTRHVLHLWHLGLLESTETQGWKMEWFFTVESVEKLKALIDAREFSYAG